jgi:hypothetical protein
MELENITFSEVRQVQKLKPHVFSHMWNISPIQIQAILYENAKGRSLMGEGG